MKIELIDIETFYNKEIEDLRKLKNNPPKWLKDMYQPCENSINRGLGVAYFVQQVEPKLKFEDVNYLYTQFCNKIGEIEKGECGNE